MTRNDASGTRRHLALAVPPPPDPDPATDPLEVIRASRDRVAAAIAAYEAQVASMQARILLTEEIIRRRKVRLDMHNELLGEL